MVELPRNGDNHRDRSSSLRRHIVRLRGPIAIAGIIFNERQKVTYEQHKVSRVAKLKRLRGFYGKYN